MARSAKSALAARGLRARKSLGQNFLTDPHILQKVVASANLTRDDTVLEIGPGLGHLTRALAARAGRVIAVELDRQLAENLAAENLANVRVVNGDILKQDIAKLVGARQSYKVVANIPYYITSNVLRHLLTTEVRPSHIILTLQRQVAQRITARPPEMSLLALSVQFFASARIGGIIPAGAFYPRPKVDSAWVVIELFDRSPYPVRQDDFFRVVRAGFSTPRKQLRNTLARGLDIPTARAELLLTRAGIKPARRAETLTIQEWVRLTRLLATD